MLRALAAVLLATVAAMDQTTIAKSDDLPRRALKYEPLPPTAVGVILFSIQHLEAYEGRVGPADAVAFQCGMGRFRWIYIPAPGDPQADDLSFGVGKSAKEKKLFKQVRLATREALQARGMTGPFDLVQVEVNGGFGSAPEGAFVATSIKRLDGTKGYNLNPAELVDRLTRMAQATLVEQKSSIAAAMLSAQNRVANGRKPTGPEDSTEYFWLTWLPKKEQILVTFESNQTNGFYVAGQGVEGPKATISRGGTQFGVKSGIEYLVDTNGHVLNKPSLEIKQLNKELGLPQGASQ